MKVAILSREPQGSAAHLEAAFSAAGHEVRLLDTTKITIDLGAGEKLRYEGELLPLPDIVLPRIGHSVTYHGATVLRSLEACGATVLLSAPALIASRDKLQSMQVLDAAGISIPPTCYVQRRKDLAAAIARLGGAPLIVKVLEGTQGRGVILAETARGAEATAETLLAAGQRLLLQRFIAESRGRDTRVLVVGDRAAAAADRVAEGDEYRSNVHRGATASGVINLDASFEDVAVRATKALGLEIAGVDLLHAESGPMVVEVNSSPGIVDFEKVTERDVAGEIVAYAERRARSSQSPPAG